VVSVGFVEIMALVVI